MTFAMQGLHNLPRVWRPHIPSVILLAILFLSRVVDGRDEVEFWRYIPNSEFSRKNPFL